MSLLRRAMEGEDTNLPEDSQTIVLKGPLSDSFTHAINMAYAKKDESATDDAGSVGLESAAIDSMVMARLAQQMSTGSSTPTTKYQTVYGVGQGQITNDNVVEIVKDLAEEPESGLERTRGDYILIIDGTKPDDNSEVSGAPVETYQPLQSALESMVLAYGGKVFHSLEEFAKSR